MTPRQSNYSLYSDARTHSLPEMVSRGVNTKKTMADRILHRNDRIPEVSNETEGSSSEELLSQYWRRSTLRRSVSVEYSDNLTDSEKYQTVSLASFMGPKGENYIDGVCIVSRSDHITSTLYASIGIVILTFPPFHQVTGFIVTLMSMFLLIIISWFIISQLAFFNQVLSKICLILTKVSDFFCVFRGSQDYKNAIT